MKQLNIKVMTKETEFLRELNIIDDNCLDLLIKKENGTVISLCTLLKTYLEENTLQNGK